MHSFEKLKSKLPFRELILFGLSGVVGYIVDVSVTLLLSFHFGVYAGRVPAFLAAATVTWLINRKFTFGPHTSRHTSIRKEYVHYLSLMVGGLIVNYAFYAASVTLLRNVEGGLLVSVAIGSLAGMSVNYMNSKKHIYNRSKN